MKLPQKLILRIAQLLGAIAFLPVLFAVALFSRLRSAKNLTKPRLVWGSTPIINNSYWSKAMRRSGYLSDTFTFEFYKTINSRADWDKILAEKYKILGKLPIKNYIAFLEALLMYDVFFISSNGFFIGNTPLNYFQAKILKAAKKKVVLIPYGSDSYVYSRIRSVSTAHGLLMSYPAASKKQKKIAKDLDYWVENADAVIPGIMGPDGFGRWDVLTPSPLTIDLNSWKPSIRLSNADGIHQTVVLAHAPNHRGFKGTEFILNTIKDLKNSGLKIEIKLLEKLQNSDVKKILCEDIDILVEQLIFTGHGLNGLEGMASGLPTISNLEDDAYIAPMRRWSFFSECPLVSASPETLRDVMQKLITRPQLRHELGHAGRAYVEKYHGGDSAHYLFTNVIDYVYDRKDSLINLYHPLLGEYPNRSPKVQHPLVNNQIIN